MILGHVESAVLETGAKVASSEHRVVRQYQKGRIVLSQQVQEPIRPVDRMLLANEHAIHVDEPRGDLGRVDRLGLHEGVF